MIAATLGSFYRTVTRAMPAKQFSLPRCPTKQVECPEMRIVCQAALMSMLLVSSLACGQESTKATSKSGPSPLEVKLTKAPLWKDNCLELSVQRTNLSKSSIFLDETYSDGIKIYSSVNDAANTLGQGAGEAWMLVYGWTDVVREPISLAPGAKRQNTFCVDETFPVKEMGKETLRQVRVQGKLRIVSSYGQKIPTWRITGQSQGRMKRTYSADARQFKPLDFW